MSGSPDTSMTCDSESDEDEIESKTSDHDFWLDEFCLEPFMPLFGCSQLCNACSLILELSAWKELSHNKCASIHHLRYWTTLRSSAERGCLLCTRLLDEWKGYGDEYEETAIVSSKALVEVGDHGVSFCCSLSNLSPFFCIVNPACKFHFKCIPIQMLPRNSNTSSRSNDVSQRPVTVLTEHLFTSKSLLGRLLATALFGISCGLQTRHGRV